MRPLVEPSRNLVIQAIAKVLSEDIRVNNGLLLETTCPACSNPNAYIGLNVVECPNPSCKHYKPGATTETLSDDDSNALLNTLQIKFIQSVPPSQIEIDDIAKLPDYKAAWLFSFGYLEKLNEITNDAIANRVKSLTWQIIFKTLFNISYLTPDSTMLHEITTNTIYFNLDTAKLMKKYSINNWQEWEDQRRDDKVHILTQIKNSL